MSGIEQCQSASNGSDTQPQFRRPRHDDVSDPARGPAIQIGFEEVFC